jgi:uncharacterized protein involved in outer membrane biogenesis
VNSIYIGVGLTIIAALVAALIGPFFVDWSAHRAIFEREIARMSGIETRILGDVDMRLLPSPRLIFGDVVIGPVETPLVRVGRFELDLEVAPLVRGEVKVAETRLERPAVDVEIDEAGRVVWPESHGTGAPATLSFDFMEITDGRLSVSDRRTGGRFEVSRIAATGTAASLAGPWKFDGGANAGGRQAGFRLSAGRVEGGFGVKLQVAAADDPATATLDAVVRVTDGTPGLTGALSVERKETRAGVPAALGGGVFRLDGRVVANFAGLGVNEATLSLGPEERAQQLTGEAQVGFGGDRRFEMRLAARQIDLDRLAMSGDDRTRPTPAGTVGELVEALGRAGEGLGTGRLSVDFSGLVLGGGVVQDLAAAVVSRPGGLTIERFETRMPGRARLELSGKIVAGTRTGFEGRADLSAEQPALTAAWWRGRPVASERFDAAALAGEVSLSADRVIGEDLSFTVGSAKARGRFDWRRDRGLDIAASAERLEFDQLIRLGRTVFDGDGRPSALALDLDAGTMVVGGIAARTVAVRAKISDETLSIEKLTVADFAGAKIGGSGRVDRPTTVPDGTIDLSITAARPEAAVRAIGGLLADPATVERAAGVAVFAGPLDVRLKLSGRATGKETSDVGFTAEGRAAGAVLAIDGHWVGRIDDPAKAKIRLDGRLDGAAPTGALARALGPLTAKGPVAVSLKAEGTAAAEGLAVDATATLGGGRIAASGRIGVSGDATTIAGGRLAVASPDATTLATLAGRPLVAIERRLPVDLTASVSGTWPRLDVSDLVGSVDGARIRAGGRVDLGLRPVAVAGTVDVDRVEAATLVGLLLGEGAISERADGGWSDTALGDPAFAGLADLDLGMAIGRAGLGDTLGLDRLGFRLEARAGRLRVGEIRAGLAGGRIDGEIGVDRDPKTGVRLDGRVSLAGASLEDVAWRIGGRPVATGRIGGEATVSTGGRSVAAMVAGLTGQGRLRLDGVGIEGFGIDAMAATAVAADSGAATTPGETERVFAARMAASRTSIDVAETPFAMEAGVARSGRVIVETPNARITGRAALDLVRSTIDADWTMEPVGTALEAVRTVISKATPSAGIGIRGPLDRPEVRFDTRPLAAWLTLRSFEKEIDRVETLQQDIMERQRFARERRRLEEIHREQEAAKKAQEAESARKAQEAAEAAKRAQEGEAVRRSQETEAAKRAQEAVDAARRAQEATEAARRAQEAKKAAEAEAQRRAEEGRTPLQPAPTAPVPQGAGAPPPLPPPIMIAPAPPILGGDIQPPASGAPMTILPPAAAPAP